MVSWSDQKAGIILIVQRKMLKTRAPPTGLKVCPDSLYSQQGPSDIQHGEEKTKVLKIALSEIQIFRQMRPE